MKYNIEITLHGKSFRVQVEAFNEEAAQQYVLENIEIWVESPESIGYIWEIIPK